MYPLRDRQGAATIALAAPRRNLEFRIVGSTVVHRLPHAAGVRRRRRDRQGHRSEQARQQQNQHESGGQTTHGLQILLRRPEKQSVSARRPKRAFGPADIRETVYSYKVEPDVTKLSNLAHSCTSQRDPSLSRFEAPGNPAIYSRCFINTQPSPLVKSMTGFTKVAAASRVLMLCRESWPTTSARRQTRNASREKIRVLCARKRGR
jgi:hypothetical protein